MKLMLVRPPRYMWPIINESDNFLLPAGLPSVAAAARNRFPDIDVQIVDCPPLKIGWSSLKRIIEDEKPDMIGAGEEALYHHEAVKVFELAKSVNPDIITVGGGHFFSWTAKHSIGSFPIDYIVRFEGDETFPELLSALMEKRDPATVQGVAYKRDGEVVINKPRPLIQDLDSIPMPAYDLMPMGRYAPRGYLWPQSATIERSRGCIGNCTFCSLWTFWGEQPENGSVYDIKPRWRQKSVERAIAEVDELYNRYNRRYLLWADPTWNVDAEWSDKFCEALLSRGYKDLYWWAFLRAEFLIRDEKLGVMEKMVRAGLIHPLIGVERPDDEGLKKLSKHNYSTDTTAKAYAILRKKYPQVFRQGTFVTCLKDETKESMDRILKYAIKLKVDYPAFHPIAPVPGTIMHEEAVKNDELEITDYKDFDWFTPVWSSESMTREQLAAANLELNKRFVLFRPHWAVRGLFSKHKHTRGLYRWFFYITLKMVFFEIKDILLFRKKYEGLTGFMKMKKPAWYDS